MTSKTVALTPVVAGIYVVFSMVVAAHKRRSPSSRQRRAWASVATGENVQLSKKRNAQVRSDITWFT
jgi:hypothetical protein